MDELKIKERFKMEFESMNESTYSTLIIEKIRPLYDMVISYQQLSSKQLENVEQFLEALTNYKAKFAKIPFSMKRKILVSDNKKYNEENCSNTTGNLKKSRIAAEELRDETLIEVSKQASTPDRQEAILKMPKLISRSCKLKNTFPDKHENNSIDNHISKAIEINNRVPEFHKIYQVITEKCYVLLEDSVDNSSLLKNLSEKFSSINESVNLKKPSMNENPGGGQNPLFSTSNDCIDDLIKGYKVPSSESNGDPLRKLSTSSTPQLSKEDFKNNECLPKQPASFNLQPSTFIKESLEMTSSNTKISILKPSKLMMSLEINSPMSVIPTESLNILSSATKESAIPKYQQKMIKHEVPIKDKEMRLSFCKEPLKPTEDSFQNEPRLSGSTVIQMTSSETGQSTKPLNTASEGSKQEEKHTIDAEFSYHLIERLGFCYFNGEYRFICHCKLNRPRHSTFNSKEDFLRHIITHESYIWSRYCQICQKRIGKPEFRYAKDEYLHLDSVHLNKVTDERRENDLQPWLSKKPLKSQEICYFMLQKRCLQSLYKCMAINCCYFTSNKEYFSKHLSKHSLEDNYLRCSYCLFEADTEKKIIDHILILHAFDKYQCEHCFYRSVVPGNVLVHSQQYHKQNSHLVLVNLQDEINERQELKKIKATQMRFVKPMICLVCDKKIYAVLNYKLHLETHKEEIYNNAKCRRCEDTVNISQFFRHLKKCYQISEFQCMHCPEATAAGMDMNHHLANNHPSELPVACWRKCANKKPEQDSVESLQIITFLPQVKVSDKRACQFLDNQLDRAEIQEKCSVNCVYCHPKN